MSGPIMIDAALYASAGIDPSKVHPNTPYQRILEPLDVEGIVDQQKFLDQQTAINRYVWYNLPPELDGEMIERILYYRGQGMFYYDRRFDKFFFLPYTLDGEDALDIYGRYSSVRPMPFMSGASKENKKKTRQEVLLQDISRKVLYEVLTDEEIFDLGEDWAEVYCVTLSDYSKQISQTTLPRSILNEPLLRLKANCIPYMNTALLNSTGIQGMLVEADDQARTVRDASQEMKLAALTGDKWIPLTRKLGIEQLTNPASGTSEDFMRAMQSLENYRLSLYGLDNNGVYQKNAHMLEAEQRANTSFNELLLMDGLKQRQKALTRLNAYFGWDASVELSEVITGNDINMDAQIQDEPYDSNNAYEEMEGTTNESV